MDIEIPHVAMLKKDLSNDERLQFDMQYASQRKSPSTALILSLFLGGLGVDRFYIGNTGLGLGKLLTFGGFGLWALVDWFLIMGATRRRNMALAGHIQQTMLALRPSGAVGTNVPGIALG